MGSDIQDLITTAAAEPSTPVDPKAIRQRARRQQQRVTALLAAGGAGLVILLVTVLGGGVTVELSPGPVATTGAPAAGSPDAPPPEDPAPAAFEDPFADLPEPRLPHSVYSLISGPDLARSFGKGFVLRPGATLGLIVPYEAGDGSAAAEVTFVVNRIAGDGAVIAEVARLASEFAGERDPGLRVTLPEDEDALYAVELTSSNGQSWREYVFATPAVVAAVMVVEPREVPPGGEVTFAVENRGTTQLEFGSRFRIERWNDGAWEEGPFGQDGGLRYGSPDGPAVHVETAELRILPPGGRDSPEPLSDPLFPAALRGQTVPTPGWYRVVKTVTVSETGERFEVSGRFTVVEPSP